MTEPDTAILKKLAVGRDPQTVDASGLAGALLDSRLNGIAAGGNDCILIVRPTASRSREWWARGFMFHFKDGISIAPLSDGQVALCSWSVAK